MKRYQDKVSEIVDSVDVGKPVYTLRLRRNSIDLSGDRWEPKLDGSDFTSHVLKKYITRKLDLDNRKFVIHTTDLSDKVANHCTSFLREIFMACSPYAEPRRTNIYKSFMAVINDNHNNTQFRQAAFDICEYYFNQTKTESIKSNNNDVHRTNIYNLLCLMEKRYGKERSN